MKEFQTLKIIFVLLATCYFLFSSPLTHAAVRDISFDAQNFNLSRAKATIFFTPRTATILEGSTFEVPIFINTHGTSINTLELQIKFDQNKFIIVRIF